MNKWISIFAVIPAQDVAPRGYFLKELATPEALWILRLVCIAVVILLIILYRKTK